MDILRIIQLEQENLCYIHLYKEGNFWKAYEQSKNSTI
jgi:hypothetical protein